MRSSALPSVRLPQPLSPTRPTTSPRLISSVTLSMALTQPVRVLYWTDRFSILTSVPLLAIALVLREARVEDFAQALAQHTEPERDGHDHDAGEGHQPPCLAQHPLAQSQIDAPVRRVRRQAKADEAQARLGENGVCDVD